MTCKLHECDTQSSRVAMCCNGAGTISAPCMQHRYVARKYVGSLLVNEFMGGASPRIQFPVCLASCSSTTLRDLLQSPLKLFTGNVGISDKYLNIYELQNCFLVLDYQPIGLKGTSVCVCSLFLNLWHDLAEANDHPIVWAPTTLNPWIFKIRSFPCWSVFYWLFTFNS